VNTAIQHACTALVAASLVAVSAAAAPTPGHGEAAAADEHSIPRDHGEHEAHGGHEPSGFGDVNWLDGLLGEQGGLVCGLLGDEPGDAPTILCRAPGTGVPVAALVFNIGLLCFLFWTYGRRPLREGLRRRRDGVQREMDAAARMRNEAAQRLAEYRDKLEHIDAEVDRVRREMRAAGEAERSRILEDARTRQERLEKDARLIIEQEFKAARDALRAEVIRSAGKSARELLQRQVSALDHQRIGDEYLTALGRTARLLEGEP